ncbi:hypothetical protein [Xanthomonas sp. 1678]|uniref:hypothetical protein n=1 Tax=Xanthomonas sp. 1678 TaxID=3158788 RepID=UPI0028598086|nr:hypothetical protein [Xanthomonas translucens]
MSMPHLWLLSLCVLSPAMAAAQSLQPAPKSPTATRQATTVQPAPAPVSTRPVTPPPTAPMPSGLGQRAQPAPIPQQGPSRPAAPASTAPGTTPAPAKVYDRSGRLIPGAVQAGPNRVLDTRSGRYYSTVPSGDGQRIDD